MKLSQDTFSCNFINPSYILLWHKECLAIFGCALKSQWQTELLNRLHECNAVSMVTLQFDPLLSRGTSA